MVKTQEAKKRPIVVYLTLAIVVASFASIWCPNYRAESRAHALCTSMHVGDNAPRALALIKASGGRWGFKPSLPLEFPKTNPSFLIVWFGVFPTSKYECFVYQSEGKVTKLETFYED